MSGLYYFWAFPRSGATLLSSMLNNHENIIVTPEMQDIASPGAQLKFSNFVKFFNDKFDSKLPTNSSLRELADYSVKSNITIIYRIWALGKVPAKIDSISSSISVKGNIILLRNFYQSAGSSISHTNFIHHNITTFTKYRHVDISRQLDLYEGFCKTIGEINKSFILYYNDMTECTEEYLKELIGYLGLNGDDVTKLLKLNTNKVSKLQKSMTTGDSKIWRTKKVRKGKKYYKFQFWNSDIKEIEESLSNYKFLRARELRNPLALPSLLAQAFYITMSLPFCITNYVARVILGNTRKELLLNQLTRGKFGNTIYICIQKLTGK